MSENLTECHECGTLLDYGGVCPDCDADDEPLECSCPGEPGFCHCPACAESRMGGAA